MPLVIGIDAGGSGVVGRNEEAVFVTAGGANVRSMGLQRAASRILEVVNVLTAGSHADALYVGAAGAGDRALAEGLRRHLERALPGTRIDVGDDMKIALRATVPVGDGVALIAGTGATAYAEIHGRIHRAGGHGPLLGDEGSGFAIGRDAMRLTLRAIDGRAAHSELTREVERNFGSSAHEMIERTDSNAGDYSQIAAVAPLVLRWCEVGDRNATQIVQCAAADLFDLVFAVMRHASAESHELPLVLCGGLLEGKTALSAMLETKVREELSLRVIAGREPVFGALALARALLTAQKT